MTRRLRLALAVLIAAVAAVPSLRASEPAVPVVVDLAARSTADDAAEGSDDDDRATVVLDTSTERTFGDEPLRSTDDRKHRTTVRNAGDTPARLRLVGGEVTQGEGQLVAAERALGDDEETGELAAFASYDVRAFPRRCRPGSPSGGQLLRERGALLELPTLAATVDVVLEPGDELCVELRLEIEDADNTAQGDTATLELHLVLEPADS